MKIWVSSFPKLYSIDVAVRKNLNRLKKGQFFHKTNKNDLILDLFSGCCDTTYGLKNYGYNNVVCGDISFGLLKIHKDVEKKIQLNSLCLPFKNSQLNTVIIQGGLHHLKSFDQYVVCLNEAKRVLKSNGNVFISEPANTICLKIWLFLIIKTRLWKIFSYSRIWHDLHIEEEKTHSLYLSNIRKLINYLKSNWMIELHKVGLVTEIFTLKKND